MSERRSEVKERILGQLEEMFTARIPQSQLGAVRDFMYQYYRVSPLEELVERSLDNLYGATLSCWEHLQEWAGGEQKIHVFNPDLERHGWHCGHTVIQILQRDMPFLVDSVRMALNQRGLSIHVVHSGVVEVERHGKNARVLTEPGRRGAGGPHLHRSGPAQQPGGTQGDRTEHLRGARPGAGRGG